MLKLIWIVYKDLGHFATSQKIAGSISDGVIEIFHWHNPYGL
jgi:hypothetical protein